MSNELVVIEKENVLTVFTKDNGLDDIIKQVEMEVATFDHDLSSEARRKKTASLAYKVSQTKTYLDDLGKNLVSDWKNKAKVVDANRKVMRDRLDELRDLARKPLTEWESEQKRIKEEKRLAEEAEKLSIKIENDHEVGLLMNEKFDREAEEARKAKEEEDRIRLEEEEKAKAEHDRVIAEQARLQAEKEAKEREDRLVREAQEAKEQAEREAKMQKINALHAEALLINYEIDKKESDRVDYHKRMIGHIKYCGIGLIGGQPQPFGVLMYELENKIIIDDSFEEFKEEAIKTKEWAISNLISIKDKEGKKSKEIAEQARKAEIQRQQEEAQRQKEERDRQKAETERLERERKEAIEREEQLKREAELSEQRRIEFEKQVELDRIATQEKAKREAEEAAEQARKAEIQRQQEEAQRQKEEQDRLEANKRHAAKIHNAMVNAIIAECGIDEEIAKNVVRAIAGKKVPHIVINY
jgi:colicin import membrane protein